MMLTASSSRSIMTAIPANDTLYHFVRRIAVEVKPDSSSGRAGVLMPAHDYVVPNAVDDGRPPQRAAIAGKGGSRRLAYSMQAIRLSTATYPNAEKLSATA